MVGTGDDFIARAQRNHRGADTIDVRPIGGLVVDENVILAPVLDAKMDAADIVALQHEVAGSLTPEPGFFKGQADCLAALTAFRIYEFQHGSESLNNTAR